MENKEVASLQNPSITDLICRSQLLQDIRTLITETRSKVAVAVNSGRTMLCWRVGNRTYKDILVEKRVHYGKEIFLALPRQLGGEYGKGFAETNLKELGYGK